MNTIYIGNTLINDVYLGSQRIDDVLTLDPKFEAQSSLIGVRMTTPGISGYQIRNWRLVMEFQTKMPDLSTVTNPLPY